MIKKIKILGMGNAVPTNLVTHKDFDILSKHIDSLEITGVKQRYMSLTETASELGAKAANEALKNTGLNWFDIDCLVVASATMDKALPYNAAMLLSELNLDDYKITTLDISASCMSFLVALDTISYMVEAGRFKNVMIVSSDISSYCLDFTNLKENGIFGDGAAAAIITKTPENETSKIIISKSVTLSKGIDFCQINAGGTRFHNRNKSDYKDTFTMKGRNVFSLVMREFPQFIYELLEKSQLSISDIDCFVPHQASLMAMNHLFENLKIDSNKWINIFENYGNQVAASLPTALSIAINSHKIKRKDKVYLLGSGAGVTLGGLILEF
jgi:3-oxoacyl-[acyl-carrier-protein] synthase-3